MKKFETWLNNVKMAFNPNQTKQAQEFLFIYLFIYLFIKLFVNLFIYLFICLFVCLFIYLFIYSFVFSKKIPDFFHPKRIRFLELEI